MEEITKKIKKIITENNVVLFMKGTSSMPQCGFSSRVAGVLNYLDIEFQDIPGWQIKSVVVNTYGNYEDREKFGIRVIRNDC